jgi:hypothetical protein
LIPSSETDCLKLFSQKQQLKNNKQFSFALTSLFFFILRVIHGFETLDAFERIPVDAKFRPQQPLRVKSITIHANPIAESE